MKTHLSLFSGIGGLDLAAEWAGFKTVGQCEIEDYPIKRLEKHWPDVPRWRDVKTLTKESFHVRTGIEQPTVVSGGFPCQPHSIAGKRLGSDDKRDLWGELLRVFCETGARWLVAENVRGLLSSENGRFFGRVLRDLANVGCNAWWYCYPAHAVGAPFWGERVALVATAASIGRDIVYENQKGQPERINMEIMEKWKAGQNSLPPYIQWPVSRPIGRIDRNDDGIPEALDEMKAYGSAVVPLQFLPIFQAIAKIEEGINAIRQMDFNAAACSEYHDQRLHCAGAAADGGGRI